jgi:hypothetical protein
LGISDRKKLARRTCRRTNAFPKKSIQARCKLLRQLKDYAMSAESRKSDKKASAPKNGNRNEELFAAYLEDAALLPEEDDSVFRQTST